MLHIEFDADRLEGEQWLVVKIWDYGFSVISRHPSREAASAALAS